MTIGTALTLHLILLIGPVGPSDASMPNDPLFDRQVSFVNPGGDVSVDLTTRRPSRHHLECKRGIDLNIETAWRVTTGSPGTVVAILDDGFFYEHEDLRDNIWHNPGETGVDPAGYPREANGIDDDRNGYIDDVIGWDFAFNDPDPDCYVFDGMLNTRIQPYWHSISALGIIGARGNNGIGVAGINWNISMMLLKMCPQGKWPAGTFSRCERAAQALRYAADNGARVVNWSGWVPDTELSALAPLHEAFDYAQSKGVLVVLAAGNRGNDLDIAANRLYPQCFENDNILVVAEVDLMGELDSKSGRDGVSSSNYGERSVDIAAIGRNYTTNLYAGRSTYSLSGGTSNASPVVTGVAALVLSIRPNLDYRALKSILMRTAHRLPSLEGKVACGGMIDAGAAITAARDDQPKAPGHRPNK